MRNHASDVERRDVVAHAIEVKISNVAWANKVDDGESRPRWGTSMYVTVICEILRVNWERECYT